MKRFFFFSITALLVSFCVVGAGGKPSKLPGAATAALKKYRQQVADADAVRSKAVDKARLDLVADLKSAQKAAMNRDDIDGATACAELAKQSTSKESFGGRILHVINNDQIRLNADNTITHSDSHFTGRWAPAGNGAIAIYFDHGYVDVFELDDTGTSFKATSYKKENQYQGTITR